MKILKNIIIPPGDGLEKEYEIKGDDWKNIVFCIRDTDEELFYAPMTKEDGKYCIEIEEEMIQAIWKWEYTFSVRIQDSPKKTVWQWKLTIE